MKGIKKILSEFWNGPEKIEEAQLSKIIRSEFVKERPARVTFERLLRYYALTPQIKVAIDSYSELITGTDMIITTKSDEAKEFLDEWIRKTDFYNKFEGLVTSLLICGNAIFEKLDTQRIDDVTEVDMASILDKRRDEFGNMEYYEQRQQQGQVVKLGEGTMDKFIEFNLTHYSKQPWGDSLFYSLAVARTAGNRTTAPLVEVMWGIEDAMGGIYQNNAYPITTITYPGANDVYLEKEAERWRRYKPGDKRVQKIKPEIEFFESQGSQSRFVEIINHLEKTFELGTQFPHDILTGEFTSRASSETTENITMKRVRGFQRYLSSKLKSELFEIVLEQNGFNPQEEEMEISFTTQNVIEITPDQIMKLFTDKIITLNEVRNWFRENTGTELPDDKKIEQDEEERKQQFEDQSKQDIESLVKRVEIIHQDKKSNVEFKKLAEKMDRKLELAKEAIQDDKVELARKRVAALESIIKKIDEIG